MAHQRFDTTAIVTLIDEIGNWKTASAEDRLANVVFTLTRRLGLPNVRSADVAQAFEALGVPTDMASVWTHSYARPDRYVLTLPFRSEFEASLTTS